MRELDVRLLGEPAVLCDGRPVEALAAPRSLSLLGLLVVNRHTPLPRQRVAFSFWPDSTEAQARTNLRQALHHLRRALPDAEQHVDLDGPLLAWRLDSPAHVDLVQHDDAAIAADQRPRRATLAAAVDTYAGPLLLGLYDDWVLEHRERLHRAHVRRLRALVAAAEADGDVDEAVRRTEDLVAADPVDERGYRLLMRLLAPTDRGRALRAYHSCARALEVNLGVAPSAETIAAYRALVGDAAGAGPLVHGPAPLVGRQREWDVATSTAVAAFEGMPSFLVLTGEPGIGKSRLAEELVTWAAGQGAFTATARCYQAEGRAPYGPIVEILRSPAFAAPIDRLDDVWRAELARLLPELAVGTEPLGPASSTRLRDALARALTGIGRPALIVVDDLQWCDDETLAVLHYVVRTADEQPLLVVGAARDDALANDPGLGRTLDGLRAAAVLTEVVLDRLDTASSTTLARDLLGVDASDDAVAALVDASEGSPLFLVELARAGREDRGLPRPVQAVIASHLAQLSPRAGEIAGAAAILGRTFDSRRLADVLHTPPDDIVDGLDELWRRRIVRIRGAHGYDFTHDRIRDVAAAAVGPGRQRELHRRVAQSLLAESGARSELAATIAAHYDQAGDTAEAVAQYRAAIDHAAAVYAHEEVQRLGARALDLLDQLPSDRRWAIVEAAILDRLLVAAATGSGLMDRYDVFEARLIALRSRHDLPSEPTVMRIGANARLVRLRFRPADDIGRRLLDLAGPDALLRTEGHYVRGVCRFWLGDLAGSEHHLTAALDAYDPANATRHLRDFGQDPVAVCLVRLGLTVWHRGDRARGRRLAAEALPRAEATRHAYTCGYVRCFAGWLAREDDDVEGVEAVVADVPGWEHNDWMRSAVLSLRAWALGRRRGSHVALPALEHAVADVRAATVELWRVLIELQWATALLEVGDVAAASEVARAARLVAARDIPVHHADALRIEAIAAHRSGADPGLVDARLAEAAAVATAQGARSFLRRIEEAQLLVAAERTPARNA